MFISVIDRWHAMWNAVFNDIKQCTSIPAHLNKNGISSWPDPFFRQASKMQSGNETPVTIRNSRHSFPLSTVPTFWLWFSACHKWWKLHVHVLLCVSYAIMPQCYIRSLLLYTQVNKRICLFPKLQGNVLNNERQKLTTPPKPRHLFGSTCTWQLMSSVLGRWKELKS